MCRLRLPGDYSQRPSQHGGEDKSRKPVLDPMTDAPQPLTDRELAVELDKMINSSRIDPNDAVLIYEAAERLRTRDVEMTACVVSEAAKR